MIIKLSSEYHSQGTFEGLSFTLIFSIGAYGIALVVYDLLIHVVHIVAGLLLSRGKLGGIVLGLIISFYEILAFLLPEPDPVLFTPHGMAIRILFGIVIFLIISGRKELTRLQSENWRPWKNPRTIST